MRARPAATDYSSFTLVMLGIPHAGSITWLPKLDRFNIQEELCQRANLHELMRKEQWVNLRGITGAQLASCSSDYLALAYELSKKMSHPCGVVCDTSSGEILNLKGHAEDVWISGCLMQHMGTSIRKVAEFCAGKLVSGGSPEANDSGVAAKADRFAEQLRDLHVYLSFEQFKAIPNMGRSEYEQCMQALRERGRLYRWLTAGLETQEAVNEALPEVKPDSIIHVPLSGWRTSFCQSVENSCKLDLEIRDLLRGDQWIKLRDATFENLKECRMDYLELGRIVSLYLRYPFGYFLIDPITGEVKTRGSGGESMGLGFCTTGCEIWMTGCILQYAEASIDDLVRFCSERLGFKRTTKPDTYECLRSRVLDHRNYIARVVRPGHQGFRSFIDGAKWSISLEEFKAVRTQSLCRSTDFVIKKLREHEKRNRNQTRLRISEYEPRRKRLRRESEECSTYPAINLISPDGSVASPEGSGIQNSSFTTMGPTMDEQQVVRNGAGPWLAYPAPEARAQSPNLTQPTLRTPEPTEPNFWAFSHALEAMRTTALRAIGAKIKVSPNEYQNTAFVDIAEQPNKACMDLGGNEFPAHTSGSGLSQHESSTAGNRNDYLTELLEVLEADLRQCVSSASSQSSSVSTTVLNTKFDPPNTAPPIKPVNSTAPPTKPMNPMVGTPGQEMNHDWKQWGLTHLEAAHTMKTVTGYAERPRSPNEHRKSAGLFAEEGNKAWTDVRGNKFTDRAHTHGNHLSQYESNIAEEQKDDLGYILEILEKDLCESSASGELGSVSTAELNTNSGSEIPNTIGRNAGCSAYESDCVHAEPSGESPLALRDRRRHESPDWSRGAPNNTGRASDWSAGGASVHAHWPDKGRRRYCVGRVVR